MGHDGTGAAAPSWTAAATNARFLIEVGRGIDNDAGEILRKFRWDVLQTRDADVQSGS